MYEAIETATGIEGSPSLLARIERAAGRIGKALPALIPASAALTTAMAHLVLSSPADGARKRHEIQHAKA